jgi:predicted DNA-binding transcriptional regulator AlpA
LAIDSPEVRVGAGRRFIANGERTDMTSQSSLAGSTGSQKPTAPSILLLTAKEAARLLKVSLSWLAKARMRGDGPPYIRIGRSIRYAEAALIQWMKGRQRMSTSEQ